MHAASAAAASMPRAGALPPCALHSPSRCLASIRNAMPVHPHSKRSAQANTSCHGDAPQESSAPLKLQEISGGRTTTYMWWPQHAAAGLTTVTAAEHGRRDAALSAGVASAEPHSGGRAAAPRTLSALFLPAGYPGSVSDDYLPYQLATVPAHILGWLSAGLTTSSLLKAVGVSAGAHPSLPRHNMHICTCMSMYILPIPPPSTASIATHVWLTKPMLASDAHVSSSTCVALHRPRRSDCCSRRHQVDHKRWPGCGGAAACWQQTGTRI